MENSWPAISNLFKALIQFWKLEWKCAPPPTDSLPSEALDEEVSIWCSELLRHPQGPLNPPEEVRPWLLARLAVCSFVATIEDAEGKPSPKVSFDTLETILVDDWHNQLRDQWGQLVLLEAQRMSDEE